MTRARRNSRRRKVFLLCWHVSARPTSPRILFLFLPFCCRLYFWGFFLRCLSVFGWSTAYVVLAAGCGCRCACLLGVVLLPVVALFAAAAQSGGDVLGRKREIIAPSPLLPGVIAPPWCGPLACTYISLAAGLVATCLFPYV